MLKRFLFIYYIVFPILISPILNAQNQSDKTTIEFIAKIDSIYSNDFLLNNGRFYTPEFPKAQGNPFFLTEKWVNGELVIQNKIYHDKKILYDIYNDRIICVIEGPAKEEIAIKLNNDLVTGFKIENHRFIHSDNVDALPQNGFYEMIYSGTELSAFYKWKKKYLRIYTNEHLGEFDSPKKNMFIIINGNSYSIKNNNDLLKLFSKNKKQIKAYIQQHHIKLLKSDNKILVEIFQYCEGLDNKIVEN